MGAVTFNHGKWLPYYAAMIERSAPFPVSYTHLLRGMPFALTWWSLTFPVGTFVTGTSQLAVHTHLPAFRVAACIAYAGLLFTWILVAVRTARGSLRGTLLKLPPSKMCIRDRRKRWTRRS